MIVRSAAVLSSVLVCLACSSAPDASDDSVGVVRADVLMAPSSVKCITIQVVGSTTVTKKFDVGPQGTTAFDLTGLPLGSDTFTASATNTACSTTSAATYISDPVTVTVSATGAPASLTFQMRPAGATGNAAVGIQFPAARNAITEIALSFAAGPDSIAAGADGNLWFIEIQANQVARITPDGTVTEFPIPTARAGAEFITAGPDGNLWFTEENTNSIGRITTSGVITEFPGPAGSGFPMAIAAGPDGNLWFAETDLSLNQIARITPAGALSTFVVTTAPFFFAPNFGLGVTTGLDGNLWFTEAEFASKIGRMTPTGSFVEFAIPTAASQPFGIALGSDGNLWFTEESGNKIGRSTTAGVITEFALPTASSVPQLIVPGPDGNLWFTEQANSIGRITTAGVITEFAVPTASSGLAGIAAGPDGNIWFTEVNSNKVGRIAP